MNIRREGCLDHQVADFDKCRALRREINAIHAGSGHRVSGSFEFDRLMARNSTLHDDGVEISHRVATWGGCVAWRRAGGYVGRLQGVDCVAAGRLASESAMG